MENLTATVYCKSGSFALVLKDNGKVCYARVWDNADTISAYNAADIYMHFFETGDLLDPIYFYCDDYDGTEAIKIADRFKYYGIAFSDKNDEECTDSIGLICSLSNDEQQIAVPFMDRCKEHARNMQKS